MRVLLGLTAWIPDRGAVVVVSLYQWWMLLPDTRFTQLYRGTSLRMLVPFDLEISLSVLGEGKVLSIPGVPDT